MGVRIGVWEDGSEPWLAARVGRIGGSEIGTAMGWNPWESREELLDRKRGVREPRPTNDAMQRGHYLEGAVADWLADKQRLTYDDDASKGTYVHPDIPWALFNPDRITTTGELVEIKTAREKDPEHGWGRAGTDQIPLTYAAQVTWGMHVLGLAVCHVGVLFGTPFQFSRYLVRYDPEVAAHLLAEGERFIADLIQEQAA
jgi:putative phage-type endonuclease